MTKKSSVSSKGINPSSHFRKVTNLTKYQQNSANDLLVDYSNKIRYCIILAHSYLLACLIFTRKLIVILRTTKLRDKPATN